MTCIAPERLAAVAGRELPPALAVHLAACARCADALEDQRAARALLAAMQAPAPPDRAARERMAAEVIARGDQLDDAPPARGRAGRYVATGVALAVVGIAAAALLFGQVAMVSSRPDVPRVAAPSPEPVRPPAPAERTPKPRARARVSGGHAQFGRAEIGGRDVVTLRGGAITVDGRAARPVEVAIGDIRVRVGEASVRVVARAGVVETVTVIDGFAEVVYQGHRAVIETGTVWEAPDAAPPPVVDAVSPFREGWVALREGRTDDAIAAFDRATDPSVAEDAAYWAAIACRRAGRDDEARRRFDDFAVRFPDSRLGKPLTPREK